MEVLNQHIEQNILTLELNRPSVFNSINRALALALQEKLDWAASQPTIRAIIITGSGKAFCAGQDLKEATDDNMPGFKTLLEEHYEPIILKITQMPKPVIAAVNGVAAGAGANIALACDFVLASENARFIQAFTQIGLVPDSGGSYFLPRLIGLQRAKTLALLGEPLTAQQAYEWGMIYGVYEPDTLEQKAYELANKLAALPAKALALTKSCLHQSLNNPLETQLAIENEAQIMASQTADYAEGVAAFLEKRKPIFNQKTN